jgi:predicted acetyltransferase
VLEAQRDGFALSCLYASTQSLYRKVGFEQAGHRFTTRIPLSQIDVRERGAPVVALTADDRPRVEACYRDFAPRFNGMLDRADYCWNRVSSFRDEQYAGFGLPAEAGDGLDGYLYLTQRRKPDTGRHDVVLTDLAYRTPAAGRRLLGFLADFATVGDDLIFPGGPHHPILGLLPQQRFAISFKDFWMLRIADLRSALESRGYASGVSGEIHLDIRDDLVAGNHNRFVLRVEGGAGTVREGGRADVAIDARTLAAAYTGLLPGRALPLMGEVAGDESAIDMLGAMMAGGTPWMTDYF